MNNNQKKNYNKPEIIELSSVFTDTGKIMNGVENNMGSDMKGSS